MCDREREEGYVMGRDEIEWELIGRDGEIKYRKQVNVTKKKREAHDKPPDCSSQSHDKPLKCSSKSHDQPPDCSACTQTHTSSSSVRYSSVLTMLGL